MENLDIRLILEAEGIKHHELSRVIGIDHCTFSRWLAKPLSLKNKMRILSGIASIKDERRRKNNE